MCMLRGSVGVAVVALGLVLGGCSDGPDGRAVDGAVDAGAGDSSAGDGRAGDVGPGSEAGPGDGSAGDGSAGDVAGGDGGGRDGELDVGREVDADAGGVCVGVVCDPGERCDALTGDCQSRRFGVPGGACAVDGDCERGRCLSEGGSGGAIPGGFCSVACARDGDCGFGACVAVADGRACFESCDDRGECRAGWTCRPDAARPVCRIDCRAVGCPGQGRCDEATGVCGPPAFACPYDCGVGESCVDGRCVRLDGSCTTDYHCRLGVESCAEGGCVPVESSACQGDGDCGAGQRCVPIGEGGGCFFACASDGDCPADRACRADLGACVRPGCGGATGNGELLGGCGFGSGQDRPGTCIPHEEPPEGGDPGFCVEAGLAAAGEPCDAQSVGRTVAERAVQCGVGSICRGDPDDPLDPERRWAGRGACAALCAPGMEGGRCGVGSCVDFGSRDDPATPGDETRVVGLCLPVDCDVLDAGSCEGALRCRAYGLADRAGTCGLAGAAPVGGACSADEDCADVALCVSRGQGTECLRVCDPAGAACPGGGRCYAGVGWRFGVCL